MAKIMKKLSISWYRQPWRPWLDMAGGPKVNGKSSQNLFKNEQKRGRVVHFYMFRVFSSDEGAKSRIVEFNVTSQSDWRCGWPKVDGKSSQHLLKNEQKRGRVVHFYTFGRFLAMKGQSPASSISLWIHNQIDQTSTKNRPKIDPKSVQNRSKIGPKSVQNGSKIGLGTDLAPNIAFGPFWDRFWTQLGAILEASWGSSWGQVEPKTEK